MCVPRSSSASRNGASAATVVGFLVAARSASGSTYVPDHEKVTVRGPFKNKTAFTGTPGCILKHLCSVHPGAGDGLAAATAEAAEAAALAAEDASGFERRVLFVLP